MAAKGRGRHQTTVVLVGMQVDQWEGLFRKGRQSALWGLALELMRSEEHTSELQSLITISYAVFCLDRKSVV